MFDISRFLMYRYVNLDLNLTPTTMSWVEQHYNMLLDRLWCNVHSVQHIKYSLSSFSQIWCGLQWLLYISCYKLIKLYIWKKNIVEKLIYIWIAMNNIRPPCIMTFAFKSFNNNEAKKRWEAVCKYCGTLIIETRGTTSGFTK